MLGVTVHICHLSCKNFWLVSKPALGFVLSWWNTTPFLFINSGLFCLSEGVNQFVHMMTIYFQCNRCAVLLKYKINNSFEIPPLLYENWFSEKQITNVNVTTNFFPLRHEEPMCRALWLNLGLSSGDTQVIN